jgi:hypothetical protein
MTSGSTLRRGRAPDPDTPVSDFRTTGDRAHVFHRTLKDHTTKPASHAMDAQQRCYGPLLVGYVLKRGGVCRIEPIA